MKNDGEVNRPKSERGEDAPSERRMGRREFMGLVVAATVCAAGKEAVSETVPDKPDVLSPRELQGPPADMAAVLAGKARVVHSVCLACNACCGVRGIVQDGRLASVSGNPYHPYNHQFRPIRYDAPVKESLASASPVCGKCLETVNHTYNPYRLIRPLKRSGPRGSGRFEPIAWERMIQEIAEGGKLFAHLGEDRIAPGLRDLISDAPIEPSDPDLGPKRNGLVFLTGRLQEGRQQFIDRFVKQSFGSINRIGHTDICGLGFRMGNFALTEGTQIELKADPESCEYMLVFGANIYEALQPGVNTYGAMVARRHAEGTLRFAIVDPRATKAAAHTEDWLAVKPGQDGALAMAMIRWIIDNKRYNQAYLAAPNTEAARALGYSCPSNATHLVICDPKHPNNGRFLRLSDLDSTSGEEGAKTYMVCPVRQGKPVPFGTVTEADLERAGEVAAANGGKINVKTAFRLLHESAARYSLQEYAALSDVPRRQIERVARDFTSHGTRAAVTAYHGAGNYVNGTFAAYAVAVLNALIGSIDRRGGYMQGGGSGGAWDKGDYDLADFPGARKPKGVSISREKAVYEKSSEYRKKREGGGSGYPARRPWFGFSAGGLCVEALSGIDEGYPYRCGVLMTYLFNPVYTIPGGARYVETLSSPEKVPLFVSIDTAINESNLYADYIVPDLCYPEGHYGWLTPHAPVMKFTALRTPMIEPLTGKTREGKPFSTEAFLIDLAEHLKLPGFGEETIRAGEGALLPVHRGEDFYLRAFANIVKNAKVPEATTEEIEWCRRNYPVAQYSDLLTPEQWKRLCYALVRGGVFRPYEDSFEGDMYKYGLKRVALYNEQLATAKNSLTGKPFQGAPTYMGAHDSAGKLIDREDREYPFTIVSYKTSLHTQSRSLWHAYTMELFPENFIVIHPDDAGKLKLKPKDSVRLVSRSHPHGVGGKVEVSRSVKPGCLAVSFHYGHTQFGASPIEGDGLEGAFLGAGKVVRQGRLVTEPGYSGGINPNELSRLDTHLNNTPLVDLVAGIPDFSNTRVKVVKA